MLTAGTVLGGYRVERLRSVGPAGESCAARRLSDGATRLLTVLAPDRATGEVVQHALRTAAALGPDAARHGVLTVLDGGVDGGTAWVVTDAVDGEDLAAVLRRDAPLEPRRALRLVSQLADALDHLHAHGLVHGHLEAASAVVVADGSGRERVVLVDVGLGPARPVGRDLASTGSVRQSLHSVTPEQLQGRAAEPAADQYALACVLTECLTGAPPFPRSTPLATVQDHLLTLPPRISAARPGLPPALDAVLARALAKDPASRYASCRALAAAVRAALADVVASSPTEDRAVLELAVVAGPAAGTTSPLPQGDTVVGRSDTADVVLPDRLLSRAHLRLSVRDDEVVVTDVGSSNGTAVQGRLLRRPQRLGSGELVEAGASLLVVRRPQDGADDAPALAHRAQARAPWPPDGPDVRMRLGWVRAAASPEVVTVDLAELGVLVLRGQTARLAGVVRNLLLQAAVLHAPDDLAVAAALAPSPDDLWSWVGRLPHARVDRAPLSGPHVATDPGAARSLAERLVALVDARDRSTRDVRDGRPAPLRPRVLALLDARVVAADAVDVVLRRGPSLQVHPVWLAPPGATLPVDAAAVADVVEPAGDLVLQVAGSTAVSGSADAVPAGVARRAAAALATD